VEAECWSFRDGLRDGTEEGGYFYFSLRDVKIDLYSSSYIWYVEKEGNKMGSEYEVKYKISIVQVKEEGNHPDRCHCKCRHAMCSIGTFDSEEAVVKWMNENKGELGNC